MNEKEFWMKVYLKALNPTLTDGNDFAAAIADKALTQMLSRFKDTKSFLESLEGRLFGGQLLDGKAVFL